MSEFWHGIRPQAAGHSLPGTAMDPFLDLPSACG
jgi:hypothetical protein